MELNQTIIEAAARAAHETNRAYSIALGDTSHVSWDDSPEWQKASLRNGVIGVHAGNGPAESHESWLREKSEQGWSYGPVKDPAKKEHPCFLPYAELTPAQRWKDHIFVATVSAVLEAFDPGP